MKILIISGAFYPKVDGSSIAVNNLARALGRQGHTVTVITRAYEDTPRSESMDGVLVIRARQQSFSLIGRGFLTVNMIKEGFLFLRKQHPGVIHAHGTRALVAALVLRFFRHVPVVATFHGLQRLWRWDQSFMLGRAGNRKSRLIFAFTSPLDSWLMRKADLITVQSPLLKKVVNRMFKVPENKLVVIQNPLDMDRFPFVLPGKASRTVLFVGLLGAAYDVGLVLRAAQVVLKALPEARFVVVGGGPEENSLSDLAKHLGIERSVLFTGRIADRSILSSYYVSSRVLVVPFRSTGYFLPLTALEAMSAGRPVITTMLLEKMEGVFATKRDSGSLAQAIVNVLLLGDGEYLKLARSTRRYVEQVCDSEVIATRLALIYAALGSSNAKTWRVRPPNRTYLRELSSDRNILDQTSQEHSASSAENS